MYVLLSLNHPVSNMRAGMHPHVSTYAQPRQLQLFAEFLATVRERLPEGMSRSVVVFGSAETCLENACSVLHLPVCPEKHTHTNLSTHIRA